MSPSAKRPRTSFGTDQIIGDRLGKLVHRDASLLTKTSFLELLRERRSRGNLTDMKQVVHPAKHLLRHISKTGYPVLFTTKPWTSAQRDAAIARGPHKSAHEYVDFLRDELADMVERATWVVLPYSHVRDLQSLRISPMGVVPQHERRPRPIVDYSYSGVNTDTVPLAPPEAMQFGRALERIVAQVVHSAD
jgi:hypothetical protein